MKKILPVFLGMFLLVAGAVSAEQLTTVGVIDISVIYSSFFGDSTAVRELEALKVSIQQELDSHIAILRRLEEQRATAENEGRDEDALALDEQIEQKRLYIEDFTRIKNRQLSDRLNRLQTSDAFINQLQSAIAFVAEANGFTIVVSANDDQLIWWAQEVDITNLVLERLQATSR